ALAGDAGEIPAPPIAWPPALHSVAICAAASPAAVADVHGKLVATHAFGAVDAIDCGAMTPSLATLRNYDAVLVFNRASFADATALGNNLATYVDGGGGVVGAMMITNGNGPAGTFR